MPVLQITALPQGESVDVPAVLDRLCSAVAEAMACPPESVWATWTTVNAGGYVIGGRGAPTVQPRNTHDPIARLSAFVGRDDATVERALMAIADTLTNALGLERGTAFVVYEELQPGRVYTGGQVRR